MEAKNRAYELLTRAKLRKEMQITPITRLFRDVARLAIRRMEDEIAAGHGKATYKDYKVALNNYLIPALGKYRVDNINFAALEELDKERKLEMGKQPSKSTLLTHNAALNRVFDEALERGFMTATSRPKLKAKGKQGVRRAAFTIEEMHVIKKNFAEWIKLARADSKALRELLENYVNVLLDTGARPGKEVLDLRWSMVSLSTEAIVTNADKKDELGDPDPDVRVDKYVYLQIQQAKTSPRTAVGRLPTVKALNAIAKRNYGCDAKDLLKRGCKDYIFTVKEYLNKDEVKAGKLSALLRPTSFDKMFKEYLRACKLLIDPVTNQTRLFYSLRHTYATIALQHDGVNPHVLAKQMGTSIGMLEKHYSHLEVIKAYKQLLGEESRKLLEASGGDNVYKIDLDDVKTARKKRSKT